MKTRYAQSWTRMFVVLVCADVWPRCFYIAGFVQPAWRYILHGIILNIVRTNQETAFIQVDYMCLTMKYMPTKSKCLNLKTKFQSLTFLEFILVLKFLNIFHSKRLWFCFTSCLYSSVIKVAVWTVRHRFFSAKFLRNFAVLWWVAKIYISQWLSQSVSQS